MMTTTLNYLTVIRDETGLPHEYRLDWLAATVEFRKANGSLKIASVVQHHWRENAFGGTEDVREIAADKFNA